MRPCFPWGPAPPGSSSYHTSLTPYQGPSGISSTGCPWFSAEQSHSFSQTMRLRSTGTVTQPRPTPGPNNTGLWLVVEDQAVTPASSSSHSWARGKGRPPALCGLDTEARRHASWEEGRILALRLGVCVSLRCIPAKITTTPCPGMSEVASSVWERQRIYQL